MTTGISEEEIEDQSGGDTPAQNSEASGEEGEVLDAQALREELNELQTQRQGWEDERQQLLDQQSQLQEEAGNTVRQYNERLAQMESLLTSLAPKPELGKRRELPRVVNPVMDPDTFNQAWNDAVETIAELQRRLEEKPTVDPTKELEVLRQEVKNLQYQQFADKEEQVLRTEYGFGDSDIAKTRNFMQRSGIASAEAAAIKIPELKAKMWKAVRGNTNGSAAGGTQTGLQAGDYVSQSYQSPSNRSRRPDQGNSRDRRRERRENERAIGIGNEIMNVDDRTPPRGGKQKAAPVADWFNELLQATRDQSIFDWPAEKRKDYQLRLKKLQQEEGANKVF